MNVGEYGVVFRIGVSFDISGESSLAINFTKPDGSTLLVTSGVTVGVIQLVTPVGTLMANQYALYTFKQGDIDQAGTWSARLIYNDLVQHLISNPAVFTIKT